jgi:hypothetical protein
MLQTSQNWIGDSASVNVARKGRPNDTSQREAEPDQGQDARHQAHHVLFGFG